MLSEEACQRIADFEKRQLAYQAERPQLISDAWVKQTVEQKRLLEENRSQLEQQCPGLWVGYSGGQLFTAPTERKLFEKTRGNGFLVQELMPSQQQLLGRKARQEFLKQAIPPDTTPYFRYIIHCADSVLDMTHGGYDLEEMHLPEFSIYLNRGAMFFGDSERYQDASIKKIYYGYLNLDRRRLLNFIAEFRAIETARKQLSQKEELLNSDKKYLQNFLSQQIKVRDEDPCLTCHHSYYDHRRLWSRSEECGASYRHTEGPCQCTKFISGRPDFQDELRQEQYQKKKLS